MRCLKTLTEQVQVRVWAILSLQGALVAELVAELIVADDLKVKVEWLNDSTERCQESLPQNDCLNAGIAKNLFSTIFKTG